MYIPFQLLDNGQCVHTYSATVLPINLCEVFIYTYMYPIEQSLELEQLASSAKASGMPPPHPLESNSVTDEEVNILFEIVVESTPNLVVEYVCKNWEEPGNKAMYV